MKPGVKTIIAGAVLFLAGVAIVPALLVLALLQHSPETQFKVPGTVEVNVPAAGRYYLWNDFQTVYEGQNYDKSKSIPDGMEIRIRDANHQELQFVNDRSTSVSGGSASKQSIGYVEIEHPGKVEIVVTGGNETRIFSFSQFRFLKMFGLIFGGAGLAIVTGLTGFGLIIYGVVKLVRSNKSG